MTVAEIAPYATRPVRGPGVRSSRTAPRTALIDAVMALRGAPSAERPRRLCQAVVEACGMQRATFSLVDDDHWAPSAHHARSPDLALTGWIGRRLSFEPGSAEHAALTDGLLFGTRSPLLRNAPERGGVVVSIRVDGAVVALLHADPPPIADHADLDGLMLLVEVVGVLLECGAARERADARDDAVREAVRILGTPPTPVGGRATRTMGTASRGVGPTVLRRPTPAMAQGAMARLTHREVEVLAAMSTGAPNADIGTLLFISTTTVKSHVKRILRKLEVENRGGAIAVYLKCSAADRAGVR